MTGLGLGDIPQETLRDRYQVQRELGKKAGRRTLLARDLETRELAVVKLLLFDNNFGWDDLKLFEREAETLKAISHPGIPRYLDYFEIDSPNIKGFALVQSYIQAQSLEEQLRAGRSFSEVEVKQLAKGILEILTYLHGRQPPVIHRDIKPSNILLTNRSGNSVGQVYLVDFGSVQTLASKRGGTMTVVGTYGYMPPEQFSGRATPASDLYSVGATLIYLVTGQHPTDLPQTDLRIEFEQSANISLGLTDWLKWMTEPISSKRLASAQEALQALDKPKNATQKRSDQTINKKPPGSKIILNKNAYSLEIIISPAGFFSAFNQSILASIIVFPLIAGLALLPIAMLIIETGTLFLIIALISLVLAVLALLVSGIWNILMANFGQMRLSIDHQEISLHYDLFGIRRYNPSPSSRQNISHIERRKDIYLNLERTPYLIIWSEMKKYEISTNNAFPLTTPEIEWLGQELSDWLGLPITRD